MSHRPRRRVHPVNVCMTILLTVLLIIAALTLVPLLQLAP